VTTGANSAAITDDVRWNLLQVKAAENRAARAVSLFRENRIEPILIKGIAAGRWYPQLAPRIAYDTDLAVAAADYEKAERLTTSLVGERLTIDLHKELRHLDSVPWDDIFSNSVTIDADGTEIRVPRPEDHLRVLCIHWLTDGGAMRERLWDMYHLVDNRPPHFDWARFLDVVSPRRRRWLECTLGMTERYLKLDLSGTPVEGAASKIPNWMTRTVEKEWASSEQFMALHVAMSTPKKLPGQLAKRIKPNPIWATIDMEGDIDARSRVFYQIGSFAKRAVPSLRRIGSVLVRKKG
jgi:hypothetical protein